MHRSSIFEWDDYEIHTLDSFRHLRVCGLQMPLEVGSILASEDLWTVPANLWLSVAFFELFSSVASIHLKTVLETLVPLPSVQASVAALLGVLLLADDQLEVGGELHAVSPRQEHG